MGKLQTDKLYAVFNEYGSVLWNTIRSTEREVFAYLILNADDPTDLFSTGLNIGEFNYPFLSSILNFDKIEVKYLHGCWAKKEKEE